MKKFLLTLLILSGLAFTNLLNYSPAQAEAGNCSKCYYTQETSGDDATKKNAFNSYCIDSATNLSCGMMYYCASETNACGLIAYCDESWFCYERLPY